MKIAMLVMNPCVNDARVIRQAETLAARGHDVTVLATWKPGLLRDEKLRGVRYLRAGGATRQPRDEMATAEPGNLALSVRLGHLVVRTVRAVSRIVIGPSLVALPRCCLLFGKPLRDLQPDVVHAHELHTLMAGWLYARRHVIPMVYDSHELEVGRNGRFLWHEKQLRRIAEGFLIRRCAAVITVCDSIADYLRDLYHIHRPLVVHNAPEVLAATRREDVKTSLGLGPEIPLAVYVGNVTTNRGVEAGVETLARVASLHLALVGPRNPQVSARVTALASKLNVTDRLHWVDPVPHEEVTGFIRTADLSLVLIQNTCLSYAMCFPNKLLESLLAGVPVVASDLVELRRVVAETGGGVVVDQTDIDAIQRAITQVLADRARYVPGKHEIDSMMLRYGWVTQRERLATLYETLALTPGGKR